jgi:hypothetical protein
LRTIRAERVEFDSASKIREDGERLFVPAIFTRESILPFVEGRGYRPAVELAKSKAVETLARSMAVPYTHISTVFVQNQDDICGYVENVKFDAKINGLVGDLRFEKKDCDEAFLERVRSGSLKDVSVAYISVEDFTPGQFGNEPYDFVQRGFVFGHVAVGVPEGRCPSPFCGMNVDEFVVKSRMDPEVTEKYVRIRVKDPDLFLDGSFRTVVLSADQGIHAVIGKLKSDPSGSTVVQNYMFELVKEWTVEKAQAWVKEHGDEALPSTSEGFDVRGNVAEADADLAAEVIVGSSSAEEKLDPLEVLEDSRRLLQVRCSQ